MNTIKVLKGIFLLIFSINLMFYSNSVYASYKDVFGPYAVTTISNGGPDGNYYIYQPTTLNNNTHPVAVFCVGYSANPTDYASLLEQIASHGVIVIAGISSDQGDGKQAITGVDWLLSQNNVSGSIYYNKLITSNVLVFGHSNGGNAALHVAINDSSITSVVAIAPGDGDRGNDPTADPFYVDVPIFYISGAMDIVVPPRKVLAKYNATMNAPAWYGQKKSAGHYTICGDSSVQYYLRAWIYTQLLNDISARNVFYGTSWSFVKDKAWKDIQKNNNQQ